MKKILSMLMLMMFIIPIGIKAQQMPQLTPLPLKEGVKSGVLPNGLHYYVLHNEEPKNRANFYIAQKVGSTLETPEQLGLAHFLEHMAFNGTKTYPGKNLLNYLQSKGIRFGADINAYTSFDETVYNIDNVNTQDLPLMDSVLLALRDWSCNILLEESEIEAERGVIHEEWRSRNNAPTRMYTKILPELYEEYQYEQMPIGSMDVVMNFPPQAIRDYYHKWYRPDQQGIIVVGDFDADVMEKKVVEVFSQIPMPENAAERTYPHVSDNKEMIYSTFEDPELQSKQIMVAFKYDPVPFEFRNTVEMYAQEVVLDNVLASLLNNRLNEYADKAECAYRYAGCRFDNYFVSKTKKAFTIVIIPKEDIKAAFDDAMAIVARGCKTGFTNSELERVDSEILASYEKLYNERDKRNNEAQGMELIRHFIDNEPAPGVEMEYQIMQQLLPSLPVEAINMTARALLTPENQVVVVSQPKVEGDVLPSRETMLEAMNSILNAEYTAYVDEVISDPLIEKLPNPGKVKSEKQNPAFGTTEFTLSNGVKVVVKPTDFEADNIRLSFFREGGYRYYPASSAPNLLLIDDAYEVSNLGTFDTNKLRKYLAGKKVSLGLSMGQSTLAFDGQSTIKDFPTLLEILYTSFTNLQPNSEQYDIFIQKVKPALAQMSNNPMYLFQGEMKKLTWGNNPAMEQADLATVESADYSTMFNMIKNATSNAANFTMVLTGNVNPAEIKPLLEQYVASLPSNGKKDKLAVENPIALAQGQISKTLDMTMQTPAVVVYENYNGDNLAYTLKNDVMMDLFADVLDNNYTTTLREEEGGTYGASVYAQLLPAQKQWQLIYSFQTNDEMAQRLIDRANKEMLALMANGTNAVEFDKVRKAAIAQLENKLRTNDYWQSELILVERGYDMISGRMELLQSLTLDDFNSYVGTIYNGKNRIQLILDGKAAE